MIRFILLMMFISLMGLSLFGCVSAPEPKRGYPTAKRTVPPPQPTFKKQVRKEYPTYYNYANSSKCWEGKETLNCKLKHAHTLIDRFNTSLESLEGAVGGCCGKEY